ncbi:RING finger protein 207-like isoform X2 [Acanthaster planci]|nr:RING finger protein 207-like isoform X2 [Acanthaster planci]
MASNVTVQSVLTKISKDHLECSICSCRFKEPKVLSCLHSFCLKCLQKLRQYQTTGSTKLTCPICRCDTKLKGNDVATLPNNFTLGALVEEFTMQEQLLEGQGSEIKCQNCEEGKDAISRCSDCESFLCLECNKAHGRTAKTKHHKVNTLEQLRSGEISHRCKLREQFHSVKPSNKVPSHLPKRCQKKAQIHKFGKHPTKFEWASHVAVFSNNEVVIVNLSCDNLISFLPKSPQSPAVSEEIEIDGLHNPRRVAVTKDDELIVMAGPIIKTFERDYTPLNRFKPGRNSKRYPSCLAVDDNNLIAVGYEKNEQIFLHNWDGTFIKKLSAPGIGDYLATYKQHLIYTDRDMHKLKSIDYYGRVVFSTDIHVTDSEDSSAAGVCCDKDGNIYVAIQMFSESDEIHQFSPDGQYIGRVIKGFDHVRGITLAPNGDLVVAEETSVVVCRHV